MLNPHSRITSHRGGAHSPGRRLLHDCISCIYTLDALTLPTRRQQISSDARPLPARSGRPSTPDTVRRDRRPDRPGPRDGDVDLRTDPPAAVAELCPAEAGGRRPGIHPSELIRPFPLRGSGVAPHSCRTARRRAGRPRPVRHRRRGAREAGLRSGRP